MTNQEDPAIRKPSQAEGERDDAQGQASTPNAEGHPDPARQKPSQAEGERDDAQGS